MLQDFIDDKSTLVQVVAWCRQAKNHYLSQCWPRSISPYGVARPQWVNIPVMVTLDISGPPLKVNGTPRNMSTPLLEWVSWFHNMGSTEILVGHKCMDPCLSETLNWRNRCHFADDIFRCIFFNENIWISLKISLKFVPKVRIIDIPASVQINNWR